MVDRNDVPALAESVRAARDEFLRLQADVAAGAPWPLSDSYGVEPEAHWGPPEVLAHVAEMVTFWTGEMERVLAGEQEPVPFGRVATDPLRLGVIERDRSLPARELFSRVDAAADRLARRLEGLAPEEAGRFGVHPTLGELTVARIVERFVVGHLEEHADQLRSSLGSG